MTYLITPGDKRRLINLSAANSTMFSRFRNFMSRHKRKFLVTGVVVGGGYLAFRFATRKLREFQESQASELIQKARRSCHFDSTEQTCNQTIMRLAPNVCDVVMNLSETDAVLEQIRSNPSNKLELWDELKVLSITKLTTLVYSSSMLAITLRVQLNLLGGYLYKDTVTAESKISNDIQQAYLSLIEHFIKEGISDLNRTIEDNVRKILANYDLKQKLTLSDIEQLFWSIQMAVNRSDKDPNGKIAKFMLPKAAPIGCNDLLQKMFNETLDMLESDEVSTLSSNNISRGFSQVVDSISEFFGEPANSAPKSNGSIIEISQNQPSTSKSDLNAMFNVNQTEIPLAKLIPIINGLGSKNFNNSVKPPSLSTSLFTVYLLSDKLKMLGANVYEVFSQ